MKASETSRPSPQRPQGARRYPAPEDILIDRSLGRREQRRLLDDWKLELEQLATATAENMPDGTRMGARVQPEELLRRVNACHRILTEKEH